MDFLWDGYRFRILKNMDYGMDMDLVLNPPGPIDHGSLPCDPYYIDPNRRKSECWSRTSQFARLTRRWLEVWEYGPASWFGQIYLLNLQLN